MSKNRAGTVPAVPPPNITYAAGGVTIIAGGIRNRCHWRQRAPGGNFDDGCARSAIAKIQDRLK